MIDVIDNFLGRNDFIKIFEGIERRETFPWYLNHGVNTRNDGNIQFTHLFFQNGRICSDSFQFIEPILNKLKIDDYEKDLLKVKINLLHRTDDVLVHGLHVDNLDEETNENTMTAIYYINTNNGYTLFEDGATIQSYANRLVKFPATIKHSGATNTDDIKYRMVLNINWNKR